ncbi:MAG: hypothetical protein WAK75_07500, partial [Methanoregula sp.]|uniref:hypothetical protein n=1 Tax=Methanoregula sp. TaxID=2052170 RepID=UPI003BAE865F
MTTIPKKILLSAALVLVVLLAALIAYPVLTNGSHSAPLQAAGSPGKLQVITSFRPITLLVLPVAGDYAQVT